MHDDFNFIAPNGGEIQGTYEHLTASYPVYFTGDDVSWDYSGGENNTFDEGAEAFTIDGAVMFLDDSGEEWLQHHLIPADLDPLSEDTISLIAAELEIGQALEAAKKYREAIKAIGWGTLLADGIVHELTDHYRKAKAASCTAIAVERGEQYKLALEEA